MNTYKIAVIAGDGVGPEVCREGMKVLRQIEKLDADLHFEFQEFPWGCEYYLEHGEMMPQDEIGRAHV